MCFSQLLKHFSSLPQNIIFLVSFPSKIFYFLVRISRNNNKYVYCKNFKYLMVYLFSSYYILTHEPKGVIKTRSTILNLKLSFFQRTSFTKGNCKGQCSKDRFYISEYKNMHPYQMYSSANPPLQALALSRKIKVYNSRSLFHK